MDDLSKAEMENRVQALEERIGRMETVRGVESIRLHPAWVFILTGTAVAFGCLALGYPQHYYQFLFSGLLLLLLYHRGLLHPARGPWRWPQVAMNFFLLCLFFKFLIGGGIAYPFDWFKLPVITKTPPPTDPSWYSAFVPDYTVQWQGIPKISGWSIDVTKIQTIFLLATFAGALFRFEPFTSIAAMGLLIASIPAFLNYNWDWVVLFLIFGGISFYIQWRTGDISGKLTIIH
jgi:hypothetical protein